MVLGEREVVSFLLPKKVNFELIYSYVDFYFRSVVFMHQHFYLIFCFTELTLFQMNQKNSTKTFKAGAGENSHVHRLVGSPGADVVIPVPTGVTIYSQAGAKIGKSMINVCNKILLHTIQTAYFFFT